MTKHEILIIESRSAQDIYDNRFEARTLKQIIKLYGIGTKSVEIINRSYLEKAINYAKKEHIRYVHISAHGDPSGFELTDGDFITWREFDELAWPRLKNTCLCFSSCSVGRGAEELFVYHKSFCNAIIAPARDISWGEGLVAFSALYYKALCAETSTAQDVKVLNYIVGAGSFRLITSPFREATYAIGS